MNELGVSKTISDEQFAQACRALGISDDFTRDLDVLLYEPELKMEMLTWMIQSGERDEDVIFMKGGDIIGATAY